MQAPQGNPDTTGQIDLNPALALERVDSWLDGFVKLLPNLAAALVVFVVFYIVARVIRSVIYRALNSRDRSNLGEVLGGLFKWIILILGGLVAATIVVPTLNPGDLIAGLGVSSVAIGFAFKDILQNWLAGLLILLRQPFQIGDQIEASGFTGTVTHIETRATIIKTYDGQKAVIPNSEIYTNAVLVKTGEPKRRSQYDIGIGYADDIDASCEIIKDAISKIDGVESDPAPQAFVWDLAASWVTIRARWWTDSQRGDVVANRSNILRAVKLALDEAGVDMPYDTKVHLFHDQTEEVDGDRENQREGWPAPKDDKTPKPRYQVVEGKSKRSKSKADG
ncbi:mechanosensitive ion channel family protein [Litorimonas sp. RW-G-Af-16]|uniref:mechanosensitive ion channel family protein n=1 Tax=Litorimonas sp. RW-G-Af-16 TaxID=3241168 RepID=UPI00390CA2DC